MELHGTGSRTNGSGGSWWRCRSGDGVGVVGLRLSASASARLVRCRRARLVTVGCVVLEFTRTKDGTKEKSACRTLEARLVSCLYCLVLLRSSRPARWGSAWRLGGRLTDGRDGPGTVGSQRSDKASRQEKAGSEGVVWYGRALVLTIDILETFCGMYTRVGRWQCLLQVHVAADLCVLFSAPPHLRDARSRSQTAKLRGRRGGRTVAND